MRGKSLALLVLALGCGLVASLGITQVLARRGDQPAPVDTVPVYVAKADIPQGTIAGDDVFKVEQWPKEHVPAGALGRQEDIAGRRTRCKLYAGQPILDPTLMHVGETSMDAQIPKGLRVVPVPVSPEAIHSGLVVPGSRCDVQVFLQANAGLGIGETISKTILQDVRVFAVNDVTTTQTGNPRDPETKTMPMGKTVSLLVTPDQAQMVTLASSLGTIRLVLRSADDNEPTKLRAFGAHELVGGFGMGDRGKENKKSDDGWGPFFDGMKKAFAATATTKPAAAKPREPERYFVRVRSGADVADVMLVANADLTAMPGDDGVWTAANLPAQTKPLPPASPTANGAPAQPAGGPQAKPQDKPLPPLKVNGPPPLGG